MVQRILPLQSWTPYLILGFSFWFFCFLKKDGVLMPPFFVPPFSGPERGGGELDYFQVVGGNLWSGETKLVDVLPCHLSCQEQLQFFQ